MKHLIAWCACSLLACGNVTAPSPDGGPTDQTPPQLVSSTPTADAAGVSRLVTLQLVFDEPLDPASVTADAFTLGCSSCSPAYTTPTYDDATRTVTLAPLFPLDTGRGYELTVGGGIRDVAGNGFAGATIAFRTRVNSVTRSVQYASTGLPTSWTATILDANGWGQRTVTYDAPGADATWLTPDDVVSARSDGIVRVTGDSELLEQYSARGPDGIWGTADDVVQSLQKTDFDGLGNPVAVWYFDSPGADGQWNDGDDHISFMYVNEWNGHWLTRSVTHDTPGADGQWNTADDDISRISGYDYDARNRLIHEISMDAGPDRRAGTADDVIIDYFLLEYDAQDQLVRTSLIDAKGLDGVAGTADDGIGPDGTWFTADDVPFDTTAVTFDPATLVGSRTIYSAPGPDQVWRTDDDVVTSRSTWTDDAQRLITSAESYKGPGPDARWGTADDLIGAYTAYHHDGDGLYLDSTWYAGPGPDGLWHTADDRVDRHYDWDDTH